MSRFDYSQDDNILVPISCTKEINIEHANKSALGHATHDYFKLVAKGTGSDHDSCSMATAESLTNAWFGVCSLSTVFQLFQDDGDRAKVLLITHT